MIEVKQTKSNLEKQQIISRILEENEGSKLVQVDRPIKMAIQFATEWFIIPSELTWGKDAVLYKDGKPIIGVLGVA